MKTEYAAGDFPVAGDELQPLREIRSLEKTQYWDFADIQKALRQANRKGIRVEGLYFRSAAHPRTETDRLSV